ncbi:MAG TPA: hypothetical protein VMZ91_16035 [Candidatus Paceibacterota bacterium]|nr:hypothetical protein [Candidatus Paceibacterota bacterium]
MDITQARTELSRRLNILHTKQVPRINQRMLRGGMESLPQRKEIRNFERKISRERQINLARLEELNALEPIFENDIEIEPEITLNKFNEPSLKVTPKRGNRGFFW